MSDRRDYNSTRTLIDFNNAVSKIGTCRIIAVDASALAILRKFVERGTWRSSYYTDKLSSYYTIPSATEMAPIERVLAEFLEESNVSCTDIEATLFGIQASLAQLAQQECCPDTRGSAGPVTRYTGEPQLPGTHILPGKSLIETEKYKCDMGHQIVDELISDVDAITIYVTTGVAITEVSVFLAAVFLTPIPFDDIIAIAALALAALIGGVILPDIKTALEMQRANLVCALVGASTVDEARNAFFDVIAPELSGPPARVLIWEMMSEESFGRIFKDVGKPLNNTGNFCECICYPLVPVEPEAENGFIELVGNDTYSLQSGLVATTHWGNLTANYGRTVQCGPQRDWTVSNLVNFTADNPFGFRIYDDDLTTLLYSSDTPPSGVTGRRIQIKSTTAFTAQIELSG